MSLHTLINWQTGIGVLGLVPAYILGVASVISAANAQSHPRLASAVIGVALALPVVLAISLIVMRVAHAYGADKTALAFLLLPWAHLLTLITAMLALLKS